jgi:hypothetical protein
VGPAIACLCPRVGEYACWRWLIKFSPHVDLRGGNPFLSEV